MFEYPHKIENGLVLIQAGDQVIEEADVHVFLQPEAAAALDDKALDAQVSEDGEVSFVIQRQA